MIRGVNFGLPNKKRDNNNTSLFGPYYKWNSYFNSMSYNVYVLDSINFSISPISRIITVTDIICLVEFVCISVNWYFKRRIVWCRINYTTTTIMMTFNLKPTRKKTPPFALPCPPPPTENLKSPTKTLSKPHRNSLAQTSGTLTFRRSIIDY